MDELTERQHAVLTLIQEYRRNGQPFPSLRVLAKRMGIASPRGIATHLEALTKKGYLEKCEPQQSGYALSSDDVAQGDVFPLASGLSAGVPREAFDSFETVRFNQGFFGAGKQVAITVSGESMSGDGINDGDIAILTLSESLKPQPDAIVAVRIDGSELTLKRLRFKRAQVELIPSNPQFTSRSVAAERIEIVGKLSGIVRKCT